MVRLFYSAKAAPLFGTGDKRSMGAFMNEFNTRRISFGYLNYLNYLQICFILNSRKPFHISQSSRFRSYVSIWDSGVPPWNRLYRGLDLELLCIVEEIVKDRKQCGSRYAHNIHVVRLCYQDCSNLYHSYPNRISGKQTLPVHSVQRNQRTVWCSRNTWGRFRTCVAYFGSFIFRKRQGTRMTHRGRSCREDSHPSRCCGKGSAQAHDVSWTFIVW